MTNPAGNEPHFLFSDQRLEVVAISATEGISTMFEASLTLSAHNPDISFDELVGQPASLTLLGYEAQPRYIHGIIAQLDVELVMPERTLYRAVLVPPHFKLTLHQRLRVFQDLTTREIVTRVLEEGGVTNLEWKLRESYQPRNFCAQYRETDMAFVSRLLEEEGIAYYFEHTESEVKTVFADHTAAFTPIPAAASPHSGSTLIFNISSSMVPDREHVYELTYAEQLRTGRVQLRDYNFRKPRLLVEGKAVGRDRSLELYDYPGEFVDPVLGRRLANVRLEALEVDRAVATGNSTCPRLLPGRRFTLGGRRTDHRHPVDPLNQEYLVVSLVHEGRQEQVLGEEGDQETTTYHNAFTVIPAGTRYRPPRVTPVPEALGTLTATVLGPPGEQIYVDEYGRVKVRFHWDREDRSTAWVRVAQSFAGCVYGGLFIPRVGQEVLVSFLEGDPDRPMVTGRVHNGEQRPPHELPAHKTRTTIHSCSSPSQAGAADRTTGLVDPLYTNRGFNELRFEDRQSEEEVYLHAQKDSNVVVNNDRATTIENDQTEEIRHNQTVMIQNDAELKVGGNATHLAKTLLLQGAKRVTFQVGKSSIVMTGAGIDLKTERLKVSGKNVADIRGGQVKLNCARPLPPVLPKGENWIDLLYQHNDGTGVAGAKYEILDAVSKAVLASGTLDGEGKAQRVQLPPDKGAVVVRYSKDPKKYEPFRKPEPHGLQAEGTPEEHAESLAKLDDLPD